MTENKETALSRTTVQDVEALAELLCETFANADPGDDGDGSISAWRYTREWEKASWRKVAKIALNYAPSPQPRGQK